MITQTTSSKQGTSKQTSQKLSRSVCLNSYDQKGVRGICGHVAKSEDSYCGNPRCCPWGW